MESQRTFSYRLKGPEGFEHQLKVVLDGETLTCIEPQPVDAPWTALTCKQCRNCPLDPATTPLCPFAARIAPVVGPLADLLSHDRIEVEADCGNRRITATTTAQAAASSLIGLIGAASGCPHTAFLKPMAWFHLPLSTEEETIFRAVTTWLLAQYFAAEDGKSADTGFDGLKARYEELHKVNIALAARLKQAGQKDASVNAVIRLDMFTKTVPWSIDDMLQELKVLYEHVGEPGGQKPDGPT